jgi:SPP1 gp7 family putative phage head morphogenesis protein
MPTPIPSGLRLGTAEPDDAVAAFDHRSLLQPSFRWQDVWQEEHATSFAVAGIAQADVLKLFREEIDLTLQEGRTLKDFSDRIRPKLLAKGFWGDVELTDPATGEKRIGRFDDARLRTIFDVNMRQSYAAGRWARIERNKKRFPYVMYRTMQDERVRASHRAWDGLVLPVDDPFWTTHYPPNGWRCRCHAFAVNERDVERRRADGQTIKTEAPPERDVEFMNQRSGELVKVPVGIDPGFAYNPGKARLKHVAELQRNTLDATPQATAAELVRQALRSPNFERFINEPLPFEAQPVAMLSPEAAAAIQAKTRTVMLSAESASKQAIKHPEIDAADYLQVQLAIDTGERIQDGERSVVYVLERDGFVAVVKSTVTGEGLFLTSLRRISSDEARRDAELRRLRAKATNKGAGGGAPQSA